MLNFNFKIMEKKKTSKADLENKKNVLFMLGLVVALSSVLLAFEWKSKPGRTETFGPLQSQAVEDVYIPVTREPEVKPPLPPPAAIEIINIVDNNAEIIDELKIEDSGADDKTLINVNPVVPVREEEAEEEEILINIIEEPAEFPGGDLALIKYIRDHVNYPMIARENGVQGKVLIQFVVDEQGNATKAEIIRSVDANLDKEALRVITTLPKFKPGKQRGKAVKVYFVAPINFVLE
jgi:protein TonB